MAANNLDEAKAAWMAMSKDNQKKEYLKWVELKKGDGWQKENEETPDTECNTDDARSASSDALQRISAHQGRRLKILCMHGGGMTGDGFKVMLGELRDTLGTLVEFVFAQAPNDHWMGDVQKQGSHAVGWWADSVEYIKNMIAQQGPFDGVLGYSMGSAAAFSLLAAVPDDTFRFAVLCCGYIPTNDEKVMEQLEARRPLRTPSLHVLGSTDFCIPNDYSLAMTQYFEPESQELLKHPGGHDVPRDSQHMAQLAEFLLRFVE